MPASLRFVYREKVIIPSYKDFVTLYGDAHNPPTISWNDTARTAGSTSKSPTVLIKAAYFIARFIIFENSRPTDSQAVALKVSGYKAALPSCSFLGYQDILYDGVVDFIFGNGRSRYEITSQNRDQDAPETGLSFLGGQIMGQGALSTVVFSKTQMGQLVVPQGWEEVIWSLKIWYLSSLVSIFIFHNDCATRLKHKIYPLKSQIDIIYEKMVYYTEYACWGPGANITGRVPWAIKFIGKDYINGSMWII
ncbi:hypothetical protein AMTRI_Chr04g182610 [Amborella trichopoda]